MALGNFNPCEVVIITSKRVVKSIMKLVITYHPKFSSYNLKEGVNSQKSSQIYYEISYYHPKFGCYTWKRVLNGKYNPL